MGGRGCAGWKGIKGGREWDNCNSIINEMYFFKKNPWSCMSQEPGSFSSSSPGLISSHTPGN